MALFRRRRDDDAADAADAADALGDHEGVAGAAGDDAAGAGDAEEPAPAGSAPSPRPDGPFDASEVDLEDGTPRFDLGGLRLSVPEGVEVRLDLNEQTVIGVTMVHGDEVMQLGVFAAPRTEGIWGEISDEIEQAVTAGGGTATRAEGPFGPELLARVPTDQPGVLAPARFVGVNGPRWFLRALFSGPLTGAGQTDPVLEQALRATVVVRGPDAMAPRDGLPLALPREALEQAQAAVAAAEQQAVEQAQQQAAEQPQQQAGTVASPPAAQPGDGAPPAGAPGTPAT